MQYYARQFLTSALVVLLVLLSAVASINYRYDPANIFGDRTYEAGVAALMVEGKDVANLSDYDERLVQKFYAEKMREPPEVLVLGSSRVMNLVPEYFGNKRFYNAGVSGASMEDLYAILQIYSEQSILPRHLVLGIDPWMFNRHSEQTRWKSLESEYYRSRALKKEARSNSIFDRQTLSRISQLISFDYLWASIKAASSKRDRAYYATNAIELDVNIRRSNGTITYKRDYAHRSLEVVRAWVAKQASQTPIYSLGGFSELDQAYLTDLNILLDRMSAENVNVILFLAPYHPDMYDVLKRDSSPYQAVLQAEQHMRTLAKVRGFSMFGSFNPAATGCGQSDFYDEMHPKPSCLDKIMGGGASPTFRQVFPASLQ